MAKYTFSTYTASTNYVSLLDDEPNDVGGLEAEEFKAKFDQSPTEIKAFINNLLIPAIQSHYATTSDIVAITQGAIADSSITEEKLAFNVATQSELDAFTASINGTASTIITNLSNHTASTSFQHFNMMTMSGSIVQMGASTPSVLLPGGARKNLSMNSSNNLIEHTESLQSLMTTRGTVVIAGSAYTPQGLPLGASGKALVSDGTDVVYGYPDQGLYVASNNVILSASSEVYTDIRNQWVTLRSFSVKKAGTVRVKFKIKTSFDATLLRYGIDSVQSGYTSSTSYVDVEINMSVKANQVYNITVNSEVNNSPVYANIKDVQICADVSNSAQDNYIG